MEWMFNSLHAFIKDPANISFSLAKKTSILCDVASGLAYLHSHTPAIIHRDLSNWGSEGYFIIKNNYNSRQDNEVQQYCDKTFRLLHCASVFIY